MKWGLIFIGLFLGFMLCCRLFLPKPPLLQEIDFSQAIYDEHRHLLRLTLTPDEKYRLYTPLNEISPLFIEATLLQEDQYFFRHPGINPIAMIKAAWQTYVMHKRQFGASTITMQVARIRYGIYSKTISGKLWQMIQALHLELSYSKEEILEAYLNLASYGGNIEGIGAASAIYLHKPPRNIHLFEALKLSVIPQNPNRRSPHPAHENHLSKACHQLFQRWLQQHPEDQINQSLIDLPLQFSKKNLPFFAPHFVDRLLMNNKHSPSTISTLNLPLQLLMENIIHQYLQQQERYGIKNAAAMIVDIHQMEVKALVGSGNYFNRSIHGQVNGTRSKRSPGSTLKPFIYALALDQGLIHPHTVLKDAPSNFGEYHPENFDKDFLGPIKAKDALSLSRNIPAIYLAEQLTQPTLYQFLQQAHINGLKSEAAYGLSLVLGGEKLPWKNSFAYMPC